MDKFLIDSDVIIWHLRGRRKIGELLKITILRLSSNCILYEIAFNKIKRKTQEINESR